MDKRNIDRVRRQSPVALAALSAILYQEDPIAINLGINPDEYDGEAAAILPRLYDCATPIAVRELVYEEFVYAFGVDIAGKSERYDSIARHIWKELPGWIDAPSERPAPSKSKDPYVIV